MTNSLAPHMRCLVLKGAGFSQGFMAMCYGTALRMLHEGVARFDAQGDVTAVCIVDSGRYQVLGGFAGRLFTVNVESDDRTGEMTFLVDPRVPTQPLQIVGVELVDGQWSIPDGKIYN